MRLKNKKIVYVLLLFLILNILNQKTYANNNSLSKLMTDVKNNEILEFNIKSNIYKKMNLNELASAKSLFKIYELLKIPNYDNLDKYINITKSNIYSFKSQIKTYTNANDLIKNYFKNLNYTIVDSKFENNKVNLKVSVNCLNPVSLVLKVMPSFIGKNLFSIISGKDLFTDKNINEIINSVNKILNENNLEKNNFEYNLEFKEINNEWILYNTDEIFKDLSTYVNTNYDKIVNFGKKK